MYPDAIVHPVGQPPLGTLAFGKGVQNMSTDPKSATKHCSECGHVLKTCKVASTGQKTAAVFADYCPNVEECLLAANYVRQ